MDEDIMNAVESLFGKDVKIVDCETSSSLQQEEVLLINGVPVKLDGIPVDDANAIKRALLDGQMPSVEQLNQLLFRAGLAQQPIEVETSLTVKSSVTTTEEVLVSRNGQILDERTVETKENFNHQSHQKEIWQPAKQQSALNRATPENALKYGSNSTFASSQATDTDGPRRQLNQTFSNVSLMSNTSSAIGSASSTTLGDKSSNISSCDSGHDGIFHSVSMGGPPYANKGDNTITDSMYCDITSSADDESDANSILHQQLRLREKDPDEELSYAKDLPKAGTLNELLQMLFERQNENIEFALLVTLRLFLTPAELFAEISKTSVKYQDTVFLHLLTRWVQTCPCDFNNEILMHELNKQPDFLQQMGIPQRLEKIESNRQIQLRYMLIKQSSSSSLGRQSSIKSLKRFYKPDNIISICSNPFELSHQLFAIEYAYLSQIQVEEFVDLLSQGKLQSNLEQTKAETLSANGRTEVNIEAYIQWFHHLSQLAATEVLKLGKKSQRAQMIDFWIDTALECFNLGNFNSLMAIVKSLQRTAIVRLKKTWAKVQGITKLNGLEHQMDSSSNYSNYRSTMKTAIWRSEQSTANKIDRALIPYFKLILKDLLAIYKSHENKLANGLINFEKCFLMGSELKRFYNCQQLDCPFDQLSQIVNYLQKTEAFSEDLLMKTSYECEPPENIEEKDHFKTLKAAKKS
ncbi:ras-GEF domain-containing family member 1B [Drosophila tropicalis]|uniref:ras-GEF domain-containing family member 1B n=1 Tax=Drosophila tropicalis TaxID=46794 RepID=UPI0035AC1840